MSAPRKEEDVDPLFPFLEWKTSEIDPKLREHIPFRYLEELSRAVVHRAELKFYNNFDLLRVTFPADSSNSQLGAKPQRGYALYPTKNDRPGIFTPLDGTALPIHETNKIDGELNLSEDTADDYLRFFCSAVHAEDGPFLILHPQNYSEVIPPDENRTAQGTLEKEKGTWLRLATDEERKKLINPFPDSAISLRIADVVYSAAVFRASFAIDSSLQNPGMVAMVDDEPILAGLKANIPSYRDGTLFVLRKLVKGVSVPKDYHSFSGSKPAHYYSLHGQSAAEHANVDQLLAALTGPVPSVSETIDVDVVFRDQAKEKGMAELLIRNRTFLRPVRIENWDDSRPLIFDNCLFSGGFSARGAKINRGLSFIGCTFEPLKICADCKDIALDLSNASIDGDLTLFDCIVKGRLFAQGLKAKSNVRLQGCGIAPADWEIGYGVKVDAVLATDRVSRLLTRTYIDSHLESFRPIEDATPQHMSLVVFDRATIGGHFEIFSAGEEASRRVSADEPASSHNEGASVIAGAMNCVRIEVEGNIALSALILFGPANFDACNVTGNFTFSYVRFLKGIERQTSDRLSLNRSRIARNLWLFYAEVEGGVSLYGVTVGGYSSLGGLHCEGDLNLNFSTIGYCAAYREAAGPLGGRHSLYVGENLFFSGAKIDVIELRGATIKRNVIAKTGDFGTVVLGVGVDPGEQRDEFWPRPCRVGAVSLTSIHVRERFDAGGIQVDPVHHPKKENRRGFEIVNSKIDGALVFFVGDELHKTLQTRWGDTIANWKNPDAAVPLAETGSTSPESSLKSGEFPCQITGELIIRACQIGGDFDLRNVRVRSDDGGISLSNTRVGLDLKAGSGSHSSSDEILKTSCRYLDGEKLSCQGDVDLSGIQVGSETGPKPTKQGGDHQDGDNSGPKTRRLGDVSLRGAHIAGDLLLGREEHARRIAVISGKLDLTAAQCEKLVLSGSIFASSGGDGEEPQAILARGHFSQVEIRDWAPSPPQPIDLQQITVGNWAFGHKDEEGKEFAHECVRILKEMHPDDRSIWLSVESDLRNKSFEWQADRVYLAMVWNSMRRRRSKKNRILRFFMAFYQSLLYASQKTFLWVKVFFGVPLAITLVTLFGLSILFSNTHNVRATVGYLHALPDDTLKKFTSREIHPDDLNTEWHPSDAIALALRYHVPLFESRTHDRWEASENELGLALGKSRWSVKMETIALFIQVIYWGALPVLLLGFAAWAFRKRDTE